MIYKKIRFIQSFQCVIVLFRVFVASSVNSSNICVCVCMFANLLWGMENLLASVYLQMQREKEKIANLLNSFATVCGLCDHLNWGNEIFCLNIVMINVWIFIYIWWGFSFFIFRHCITNRQIISLYIWFLAFYITRVFSHLSPFHIDTIKDKWLWKFKWFMCAFDWVYGQNSNIAWKWSMWKITTHKTNEIEEWVWERESEKKRTQHTEPK